MKRVRHLYVKTGKHTVKLTLEVNTGKDNTQTRPEFIKEVNSAAAGLMFNLASLADAELFQVKVK